MIFTQHHFTSIKKYFKMNLFTYNLVYIWLILAILFLIMEMGSPGLFFFLSFFFGALAAAGISLLLPSLIIQCVIFFLGTIVTLYILKQWVARTLFKVNPHTRSNIYALQGKQGRVVRKITPEKTGEVKINGELWMARSADNAIISENEIVEIVIVRGAHVVVKKMKG